MQAKITNEGECVIVHLIGRLDVETAGPFRRACLELLTDKKVIFDFKNLSFVGSSGILSFLETMQDFMKTNPKGLKFSNVGSEFRKILAATSLGAIEIFDNETQAARAFLSAGTVAATMTSGIIAVPVTEDAARTLNANDPRPQMPPMQAPKAIMEGINPIFTVEAEVSDSAMEATPEDELDGHSCDALPLSESNGNQ